MFVRLTNRRKILLTVVICVPLALLLWPPLYNVYEPSFMGAPFFFWFQTLCIIVAAALTGLFYIFERRKEGKAI